MRNWLTSLGWAEGTETRKTKERQRKLLYNVELGRWGELKNLLGIGGHLSGTGTEIRFLFSRTKEIRTMGEREIGYIRQGDLHVLLDLTGRNFLYLIQEREKDKGRTYRCNKLVSRAT